MSSEVLKRDQSDSFIKSDGDDLHHKDITSHIGIQCKDDTAAQQHPLVERFVNNISSSDYKTEIDPFCEEEVQVTLTELGTKLTSPETLRCVLQSIIQARGHQGHVYCMSSSSCSISLVIPNTAVSIIKEAVLGPAQSVLRELGVKSVQIGEKPYKVTNRHHNTDSTSFSLDSVTSQRYLGSFHEELSISLVQQIKFIMAQRQIGDCMTGSRDQETNKDLVKMNEEQEKEIDRLTKVNEKLQACLETGSRDQETNLVKVNEEQEKEIARLTKEKEKFQASLETAEERIKKLAEQKKNNFSQVKTLNELISEHEEKFKNLEAENAELKEKLKKLSSSQTSEDVMKVESGLQKLRLGNNTKMTPEILPQENKNPAGNAAVDEKKQATPKDVKPDAESFEGGERLVNSVQPQTEPAEQVAVPENGAAAGEVQNASVQEVRPEVPAQPSTVQQPQVSPNAAIGEQKEVIKKSSPIFQPVDDDARMGSGDGAGKEKCPKTEQGATNVQEVDLDQNRRDDLREQRQPDQQKPTDSSLAPGLACGNDNQRELDREIAENEILRRQMETLAENTGHETRSGSSYAGYSTQQGATRESGPLRDILDFIPERLSVKEWKPLARKLKISEAEIENIEYEHHKDAKEMKVAMLNTWAKNRGNGADIKDVLESLIQMNNRRLVDDVCKKFRDVTPELRSYLDSSKPTQAAPVTPAVPVTSVAPIVPVTLQKKTVRILFEDDFLDELEDYNFIHAEIQKVVKKLKFSSEKQMELHKTGTPANVASVCKVWENMVQPMEQSDEQQCKLIRSFVRMLRDLNRNDIVDVFKKFIPGGTGKIGTQLEARKSINDIKFSVRNQLTNKLSVKKEDAKDWRTLAEAINIADLNMYIKLWENQSNPGEKVLHTWQSRAEATVGNLYNILVANGMHDCAKLLE